MKDTVTTQSKSFVDHAVISKEEQRHSPFLSRRPTQRHLQAIQHAGEVASNTIQQVRPPPSLILIRTATHPGVTYLKDTQAHMLCAVPPPQALPPTDNTGFYLNHDRHRHVARFLCIISDLLSCAMPSGT